MWSGGQLQMKPSPFLRHFPWHLFARSQGWTEIEAENIVTRPRTFMSDVNVLDPAVALGLIFAWLSVFWAGFITGGVGFIRDLLLPDFILVVVWEVFARTGGELWIPKDPGLEIVPDG